MECGEESPPQFSFREHQVQAITGGDVQPADSTSGAGYCWGYNLTVSWGTIRTRRARAGATNSSFTWASCHRHRHLLRRDDDSKLLLGSNVYGEIGNATTTGDYAAGHCWSTQVAPAEHSYLHTCGLTANVGYCWGYNITASSGTTPPRTLHRRSRAAAYFQESNTDTVGPHDDRQGLLGEQQRSRHARERRHVNELTPVAISTGTTFATSAVASSDSARWPSRVVRPGAGGWMTKANSGPASRPTRLPLRIKS